MSDVGEPKVAAAAKRLKDLNPDVKVIEHKELVSAANVMDLIADYDYIIDGTDNFPTRYCVGDACVILGKPNIYGSIFRFDGMVTIFAPHLRNPETGEAGPCYRCLYPEPPDPGTVPSCAEGGVIGVLPGVIGTLQAAEVVKLITGIGKPAIGKLMTYDALDAAFRTFKVRRDPNCPVCGEKPTIFEPIDYEQFCGMPILDQNSIEETRAEVNRELAAQGKEELKTVALDERGLPPRYPFVAEFETTPREVKKLQESGTKFSIIDCRLPNEVEITQLENSEFIPLEEISHKLAALKGRESEKFVIVCRIGTRSQQFARILKQHGFTDARSMAGGILLWNQDVNKGGVVY
jgi:adenylyltransferase/sulfurtransferase